MHNVIVLAAVSVFFLLSSPVLGQGLEPIPAPEGARVYVIAPTDGATVKSPVTVRFGLEGMGVAPAGVDHPKTGHHHLLIDVPLPPAGLPVPADANHIHFGGGQTETTVELAPGKHTLQLILGDFRHVPHEPPVVSEVVTITVE
ncbi:MAG: DUF4399 domain-containing protein [Myxococcota bacterium]|nr:DUF4399 domain-containing protein [Myxococcota bacterium]